MKALNILVSHAQAILLEELLSTAITAAAEAAQDTRDSAERSLQQNRFRLATQMHDELDRQARDVVFGWCIGRDALLTETLHQRLCHRQPVTDWLNPCVMRGKVAAWRNKERELPTPAAETTGLGESRSLEEPS